MLILSQSDFSVKVKDQTNRGRQSNKFGKAEPTS